jgi:hypothetical protein
MHETERLPGAEKVEAETSIIIMAERDAIRARRIAEYDIMKLRRKQTLRSKQ